MDRLREIHSQTSALGSCYVLLDATTPDIETAWRSYLQEYSLETVKLTPFRISEVSAELSVALFRPGRLVPGSAHLPLLWLSRKVKHSCYWFIEDDVVFTGNWGDLIRELDADKSDLICSQISRFNDIPNWTWWSTLKVPAAASRTADPLAIVTKAFFPVHRISTRALRKVLDYQRLGWAGHFEVLIPTVLKFAGYKVSDLNLVARSKVYSDGVIREGEGVGELSSLRFRPAVTELEIQSSSEPTIYHPVKQRDSTASEITRPMTDRGETAETDRKRFPAAKDFPHTILREVEHITAADRKVTKRISFCQTCRDRLWQLEQTLHRNLSNVGNDCEIVLVDYGSTDGLANWIWKNCRSYIENGQLTFFELTTKPRWSSPRAKNLAHRLSSGSYLFNLDADNFITSADIELISDAAQNGLASHQWTGVFGDGSFGRIGLPRHVFFDIGGYDETMLSMGGQDRDLLRRITASGVKCHRLRAPEKGAVSNNFSQKMASTTSDSMNEESAKRSWQEMEAVNQIISRMRLATEGPRRPNEFQTFQGLLNGKMITIDGLNRIQTLSIEQ